MKRSMKAVLVLSLLFVAAPFLHAAIVVSPPRPVAGQAVTFSLQPSKSLTITWDFNDGTPPQSGSSQIVHTFLRSGTFLVSARYLDGIERLQVTVDPAPKSIVYSPSLPAPGETVNFRAINFEASCVRWDFGDGSPIVTRGTATQPHVFTGVGSYTVRAYDYCGDTNAPASTTVRVVERRRVTTTTLRPVTGSPVEFVATGFLSSVIAWDFGDGQLVQSGTTRMTHLYKYSGSYTVKAVDFSGRDPRYYAQKVLRVEDSQGPRAPFTLSYLRLRFEDGRTDVSVKRGFDRLKAFLDVKFEGSGAVLLTWYVDGKPFRTSSQPLDFAGQCVLDSGAVPPLPTDLPGPHKVSVVVQRPETRLQVNPITYNVEGRRESAEAPRVTLVEPFSLEPGKEYELLLRGENFTGNTVVSFGREIAVVDPFRRFSSREGKIKIFVPPTLVKGEYPAEASGEGESQRGPGAVRVGRQAIGVVGNVKGIPKVYCPKIPEKTSAEIRLEKPAYFTGRGDGENEQGRLIPLDDFDLFQWWSKPGLADGYELRIYRRDTDQLVMKKRLAGSVNFYDVTSGFLEELFSLLKTGQERSGPLVVKKNAEKKADGGKGIRRKLLEEADLSWEVSAFKVFSCNPPALADEDEPKGLRPGESREVELALSDRWPLKLPARPTGLSCPKGGYQKGSLNTDNLDREKDSSGRVDPNTYVGHRIQATGRIDLYGTPYGSKPQEFKTSAPPQAAPPQGGSQQPLVIVNPVESVAFSNLFIDWGDGSPSEPISGKVVYQSGDVGASWNKGFKVDMTGLVHKYAQTGLFTIRVFMLPEDAVQSPLEGFEETLGNAVSGGNPSQGTAYFMAMNSLSRGPSPEQNAKGAFAQGRSRESTLNKELSRAYMLFCKEQVISERMDLCANGPLNLVSAKVLGFPGHDGRVQGLRGGASDAQASTCDEALQARGELTYFGRGDVEVTWTVAGEVISKEVFTGLTSPNRSNLSAESAKDCRLALKASREILSPFLSTERVGRYEVSFQARVLPPSKMPLSASFFEAALGEPDGALRLGALLGEGAGKTPPKLGFLKPAAGVSAVSPVALYGNSVTPSLGNALRKILDSPPFLVVSPPRGYRVVAADPKQLCSLWFPTRGGKFRVCDLQGKTTVQGKSISGNGLMKVPLTSGSTSKKEYAVEVAFQNWEFDAEKGEVTKGTLVVKPSREVKAPGVLGTLRELNGKILPGQLSDMDASLDFGFNDPNLRLPGSPEKPPKFVNLHSPLSSEGDWIKSGLQLPEILLSWSAFRMSTPSGMEFDFSRTEGNGPGGACGEVAPSFVGVLVKEADIVPYTFDLVSKSPYLLRAKGWVVTETGMCGSVEGGGFSSDYKKGKLSFGKLLFTGGANGFQANYQNLKIRVPWLGVELAGDAVLKKFEGGFRVDLSGVGHPPVELSYPQFTLASDKLIFTTEKNIGWVVSSETLFTLKAENKEVTHFTISPLFFGFDGRPYFSEGATSAKVPLGGAAYLGSTPLDLKEASLNNPGEGNKALTVAIISEIHLSESSLVPSSQCQINYLVKEGSPYLGEGPFNSPFKTKIDYPLAQKVVQSEVSPVYTPSSEAMAYNGGVGEGEPLLAGPFAGSAPLPPKASFKGNRFYGDVDLNLFAGANLRAQFLLGYESGKSFFLVRGEVPLGSGIQITPYPISIFKIFGSLGYNFPLESLATNSLENAVPDLKGKSMFQAGLRLGSSDGYAFTMDGSFTVNDSGSARMDYRAWLFTPPEGEGLFRGYFQFADGNFDGKLWGGLDLVGGLVRFDLGKTEATAACDMHFGGGNWHIYAGQKNGPRISAFILKSQSDSYMMLGNKDGFAVGGRQNFYFGVGDGTVSEAYVKGFMDIGFQITPQLRILGDFAAGASAGVCAFGVCVDGNVTADVHVEAPPLQMRAHAELEIDLGLWSETVGFTVSL